MERCRGTSVALYNVMATFVNEGRVVIPVYGQGEGIGGEGGGGERLRDRRTYRKGRS